RLLARDPGLCDREGRLAEVRDHAAGLLRAGKDGRKREARQRDRDVLDCAGIRAEVAPAEAPRPTAEAPLAEPRRCYVCKESYRRRHPFYDCLCPACGDLNQAKRHQTADLTGLVALVTGGRVKIGYHTALTVRRPPAFYRHLIEGERGGAALSPATQVLLSGPADAALACKGVERLPALLTQLPLLPGDEAPEAHFPPGWLDRDGQQVDLRPKNSWAQELADVTPLELLEVHAVNCLAPFLLLRRLEPLLFAQPRRPRHVVNVSAR